MRSSLWLVWLIMVWGIVACTSDTSVAVGPRLVQEVTLAPTEIMPTRFLSPSPSPVAIPLITATDDSPMATVEVVSQADFVLVTATLPPSKTPTVTPTVTPTLTATVSPTSAVLAALQAPPTDGPVFGAPHMCEIPWFFTEAAVRLCPLNEAISSNGAYQQFEYGIMLWVARQNAIYVAYNSGDYPRWQVFRDTFAEGMPEDDPNLIPPEGLWQPRRGIGRVWREEAGVRSRLGWAIDASERPYTTQVQVADEGTIFLADIAGGIISLSPGGAAWMRYQGF